MAGVDQRNLIKQIEARFGSLSSCGLDDLSAAKMLKVDETNLTRDLGTSPPPDSNGHSALGKRSEIPTTAFQVEQFVERAAQLLDRCLEDRETFRKLKVDAFLNRLEIAEFFGLDCIHEDEKKEGFYKQEVSRLDFQHEVEKLLTDGFAPIEKILGENANEFADVNATRLRVNLAAAQGQFAFFLSDDNAMPVTYSSDATGATTQDSIVAASEKVARKEAEFAFNIIQRQHHAAALELKRQYEASRVRLADLKDQLDYAKLNGNVEVGGNEEQGFRARKYEVSKAINLAKRAATAQSGILDFDGRAAVIEERFIQDFSYSCRIMTAIEKGLDLVYFPRRSSWDPFPTEGANYIDECVAWLRRVNDDLFHLSRDDQGSVMTVSLRDMLGADGEEDRFENGKQAGSWEVRLGDAYHERYMKHARHVRLRGLLAFVETEDNGPPYQLEVLLPSKAKTWYRGDGRPQDIEQPAPSVFLGRVEQIEQFREPDVLGSIVTWNLSPFGDWVVNLVGANPTQKERLRNVRLDFVITFQTKLA